MLILVRRGATEQQLDQLRELIESRGARTRCSRGEHGALLRCIPETGPVDPDLLRAHPLVEAALPLPVSCPLAALGTGEPTVVRVGPARIGGREVAVIAGPCSVEGADMLLQSARAVRAAGATLLRGGAFKPRTSPYSFAGLGEDALPLLAEARRASGLPVVTEVMDPRRMEQVAEVADMIQIGARNMQNYTLLAEAGRIRRPVLLKRGMGATITELLHAAEHVLARGNPDVVLCERGIRTFETSTRNTLDIAAVPVLKRETHLPVLVDPSHAAGRAALVPPLACAAVAAGADGLLIEVHPDPSQARSDGDQSLSLVEFAACMRRVRLIAEAAGRTLDPLPACEAGEAA